MSLRRTFIVAFAAVAVVVAALVGAASFAATAHNLTSEVDDSLTQAAATLAAGGTLEQGLPDLGDQHDRGGRGGFHPPVQSVQLLTPAGAATVVTGTALPVTADDLTMATAGTPGVRILQDRTIGPDDYRVLTLSTGTGAIMVCRDIDVLNQILADLAMQIGGIGLGVVVAAALAGWWLARRLTHRLLRLTDAAEQVSATGRLDVAMPVHGSDEVGRLSATLDGMLGELARSRDDQQRLVQDAGHELRTPLTSLRTNISVMRRYAELTPEARRGLLDDLDGETRELTSMVNELVELATDRRTDEEPQPVDLAELAEHSAARARRRSSRTITVHAEPAVVIGRRAALDRAITNLLENAIKFDAVADHPVEVHVDGARIEVRDRGPGIAPDDAPHVFDRFYRATTARSSPGSGLGLAIVRDIARLHGGRPYLADRLGGGAVIGFTLYSEPAGELAPSRRPAGGAGTHPG
ncbi:HAMP domain-containing sensor histidine kinase [Pseudonocardia sp. GCM10023141]|uniref:HAMP domain-containing sensor histidine kinase n=1 Tax=Pseudonocardia sp. GCM10023141 TaxID=3252653 RepID=UPI0036136876